MDLFRLRPCRAMAGCGQAGAWGCSVRFCCGLTAYKHRAWWWTRFVCLPCAL